MTRIVVATLVALFLPTPGTAQSVNEKLDSIFAWTTPDAPGCVVGVGHDDQPHVTRAYGMANLARRTPLTATTVLDAGSVVKQFVAAAVLLLVEDGRIDLGDDVRSYFPELPDYGHVVTVDHLLTHTSGLRDWTGLILLSRDGEDALTMVLRQRGLNFVPGSEMSYSNSGYVLLKELVARVSGMTFADFTQRRLFEPLGMRHTRYAEDPLVDAQDLALAYEKEGDGWRPGVLEGNARGGGGGLLSTPADLLVWNDALTHARLGEFVSGRLQEPATLSNGRSIGYARGLFIDGDGIIWHSGSAGAYKTFLARVPDSRVSVAIMCNAGDASNASLHASRVVELFEPPVADNATPAPSAAEPNPNAAPNPPVAARPDAAAADVAARAGVFFSEADGQPLRLVAADGMLRIANGPPLMPVAEDRFRNPRGVLSFMSQAQFELHFVSADAFELRTREGDVTRYHRARGWTPDAAALESLAGRYESDEMNGAFDITPGAGGVIVSLNGSPGFAFTPADPDVFMRGNMVLRFVRDDDGHIVTAVYSNPVLRNIPFARIGARVGAR